MSQSGMKSKLGDEYLAASLHRHTQYYATSYSQCPDHEGRMAIRPDSKETIAGCYYNNWLKVVLFPRDTRYEGRMKEEMTFMGDTVVQPDVFDQQSFCGAFLMSDNQNIEESLASGSMLIRISTILDHRVGKRRSERIRQGIEGKEKIFREFPAIRAAVEGMAAEEEHEG